MVDNFWLGDFGFSSHFDEGSSSTETVLMFLDLVPWCLFVRGRRACETNVTLGGGEPLEIEYVV